MRIFSGRLFMLRLTGHVVATAALGAALVASGSDFVGRWKLNGTQCYWDATDTGPDQCNPNAGRWKLNGTTCYWDGFDSGPAQCDPNAGRWKWSGSACYWDGFDTGPAQCDPNHPPQPPTVALTSPTNGASFTAPAQITISATASTSQGNITSLELYSGSTLLTTATGSPCTFTWSGVGAGSYSLWARAVNSYGLASSSSTAAVTVATPPTVTLTSPPGGTTYPSSPADIVLTASASGGSHPIARVEFYTGTALLGTSTAAPYTITWTAGAGAYALSARAVDTSGLTATSSTASVSVLANDPPAVALSSPPAGAIFEGPATINLTAQALDPPDGYIARVDFYSGTMLIASDTDPPFGYTWSNVGVGAYALSAQATDNNGAVTVSPTVSAFVTAPNVAPTVTITSPQNNSTYTAPQSLSVTASASDPDDTIVQVDFFASGALIGTDTAAPYKVTWNVPGTVNRNYVLTAVARDSFGATATSDAVSLTITPATGRWKLDGASRCYWDEFDSGPNQCAPPTRVVVNGVEPQHTVTARIGDSILVQVADGPGRTDDWVGLFPQGASDSETPIDWKYLNDQQAPPTTAIRNSSVHLSSPGVTGNYETRFFSNGSRLSTGPAIAIAGLGAGFGRWRCEPHTVCIHSRGTGYEGGGSIWCDDWDLCSWIPDPAPGPPCYGTCGGGGSGQEPLVITGPKVVWYFDGQQPAGYDTSITLTSSAGAMTQWSIVSGSAKITLSTTAGASTTVRSTGTAFSETAGDILIQVTDGTRVRLYGITSRRPNSLRRDGYLVNCSDTWGYEAFVGYTVLDKLGDAMPSGILVNETWTTALANDYVGTDWPRRDPAGVSLSSASFADQIQGAYLPGNPTPHPTCDETEAMRQNDSTEVQHWGQAWRIGSLTSGLGWLVQTNSLQKWLGKADHRFVASPPQ